MNVKKALTIQWFRLANANPATLANSSQKVMVIKYQRGATLFNCSAKDSNERGMKAKARRP